MSRFLVELKVHGTVFVRFSNSPIRGQDLVSGGVPQTKPTRGVAGMGVRVAYTTEKTMAK